LQGFRGLDAEAFKAYAPEVNTGDEVVIRLKRSANDPQEIVYGRVLHDVDNSRKNSSIMIVNAKTGKTESISGKYFIESVHVRTAPPHWEIPIRDSKNNARLRTFQTQAHLPDPYKEIDAKIAANPDNYVTLQLIDDHNFRSFYLTGNMQKVKRQRHGYPADYYTVTDSEGEKHKVELNLPAFFEVQFSDKSDEARKQFPLRGDIPSFFFRDD
jgi:hypothetical protein